MVVTQMRKSRLIEMENAIRTLLHRGVTIDEIKAGLLEALAVLMKNENPHFTEPEAIKSADQYINELFRKAGYVIKKLEE